MPLTTTKIFDYLNKNELAHQVHIRNDEIIFYHWNRNMTDLIKSVVLHNDKIEQVYYSRNIIPMLYTFMNSGIVNDFTGAEKYVRDKRIYAR